MPASQENRYHKNGRRTGALDALDRVISQLVVIEDDLVQRERRARVTDQKTLALALLAQQRVTRDVIDFCVGERDLWDSHGLQSKVLSNRS